MTDNDNRSTELNRRDVLKGVGASVAVGAFGATGVAGADSPRQAGPRGQQMIVGTKHGASGKAEQKADRVAGKVDFGNDIGEAVAGRWNDADLRELEADDDVRYVEPDLVGRGAAQEPAELPWGVDRVDADITRNEGETGDGIDVAILDSGIDADHPDLQANIGDGHAMVNCVDADVPGGPCQEDWDDDLDHGTHVAGTVGAIENDSQVVGVAPEVTLHAVKVLDNTDTVTLSDMCDGMNEAIDQGYDVMNLSLVFGTISPPSCVNDAMQRAENEGVIAVASAGNDGPCSDCVNMPANHPDIIAVSSTDDDDTLSGFSSTGPEVDVAAPGGAIPSTWYDGGVDTLSGTSMASPHVAGEAALLLDDGVSPGNVLSEIQNSAEDIGLSNNDQGAGLVDVARALDYPSIETALIVDRSGSMSGSKITDAKTAAELYTGLSNMDANISVVSYSSSSRVDQEMIQLGTDDGERGTNAKGRMRVRNAIGGIGAGGSTNIGSGLNDALGQLDEAQEDSEKVAILLTDGQNNTGFSESEILNNIVPKFNNRGYCLYTVAFGSFADEQFLQEIASRADCGEFKSTGADQRLSDIYADIRQQVSGDATLGRDSGVIPANSTVSGTVLVGSSVDDAAFRIRISDSQSSTTTAVPGRETEIEGNSKPPMPASQQAEIPTELAQSDGSVELVDPDGNVVSTSDENVEKSVVGDTVIYRINDPTAGDWEYRLTNTGSTELNYEIEVTGDVPGSCVPPSEAGRNTPDSEICNPRDSGRGRGVGTSGAAGNEGEKRKRDRSRGSGSGSSNDGGSSGGGGSRGSGDGGSGSSRGSGDSGSRGGGR